MDMDLLISFCSMLGAGGVVVFLVKRYFDRIDKREAAAILEQTELLKDLKIGLETIRLLAYARMSEEIERLLTQGYATPTERHILDEMYQNYKAHGWNGDMDARLQKVYTLRTDAAAKIRCR